MMHRLAAVLLAGIVGLVLVGLAVAGMNGNYSVHLNAGNEVATVPVVSDAQGQAIFRLSKDRESLSYKLITANIENVTQAHIHIGAPGTNGGVIVWLYPDGPPAQLIPGRSDGILAEGTITSANLVGALAGDSLADLVELLNTQMAYVNVHTSQYPGGEIRGNF